MLLENKLVIFVKNVSYGVKGSIFEIELVMKDWVSCCQDLKSKIETSILIMNICELSWKQNVNANIWIEWIQLVTRLWKLN